MKNYLLKISGAGNRFLLADQKCFGKAPPQEWQDHAHPTTKSFTDFLNLTNTTLSKRKIFMESLLSNKELSLTDGLVVVRPKALNPAEIHDLENGMKKIIQKEKTAAAGIKQSHKQEPNFICDFYNRDGSTAEMCGNAACCIADYMASMTGSCSSFRLGKETVAVIQNAKGKWGISFETHPSLEGNFPFEFKGRRYAYTLISPGVPHAVIECPLGNTELDLQNPSKLRPLSKKLRFHNPTSDQGMNVSFFQVEEAGQLKAVSYERGVEDFTLACGTGALATAFVYLHKYHSKENPRQTPANNLRLKNNFLQKLTNKLHLKNKLLKKLIEKLLSKKNFPMNHPKTIYVLMPGGKLEVQLDPPPALFSAPKKGF